MRKTCLRFFALLAMLAVITLAGSTTATADPFCLYVTSECFPCGPELQRECRYYACDDGSNPVYCGSCDPFCIVL